MDTDSSTENGLVISSSGQGSTSSPWARRDRLKGIALAAVFAFLLPACNSDTPASGDGSPSADHGGGADIQVSWDYVPSDLPVCGKEQFSADRAPANLLFVLDGSASMGTGIQGGTRWSAAGGAIEAILKGSTGMRFGLRTFPSGKKQIDGKCLSDRYAQLQVNVGPVATTKVPIECYLGLTTTGCGSIKPVELIVGTPINQALEGSLKYLTTLYKGEGPKAMILLTDAMPVGCMNNSIDDAIATAKAAAAAGVTVYVLGVDVDASGGALAAVRNANASRIAEAGGGKRTPTCVGATPTPNNACSYNIRDTSFQNDMLKALQDISGRLLSCTFKMPQGKNVDPNKVNIAVKTTAGEQKPKKDTAHGDGWDFSDGGKSITLYGPICTAVKSDPKAEVTILVGCKTIIK